MDTIGIYLKFAVNCEYKIVANIYAITDISQY